MATKRQPSAKRNPVKRTERGWGGHLICCSSCLFRRNTLLECGKVKIVVSTVGLYRAPNGKFETIGRERYFETMAFHADPEDTRFYDALVSKQVNFNSEWAIAEVDADDKANDMHEAVVREITLKLSRGHTFPCSE